jgi:phytoene dehydrogenase-like protein
VAGHGTAVDVAIVGAGHNGLVAAVLLARAGLSVRVLEASDGVGGACRTERPFARAPDVRQSTGAYLLGLMPPELLDRLDLRLPLIRRDPHYFLPTTGSKHLLLGGDEQEARRQFLAFFSEADHRADRALQAELDALRQDVGRTWLEEPRTIEETAERNVRAPLRQTFVDLCRGSVGDYLERFGFQSDLIKAMYAVTDGFTGLHGTWDTPGSGMNFLIHNMCRLPGADGTWMIVRGGMGTVTRLLAERAQQAGARIETGAQVERIEVEGKAVAGVALADGRVVRASAVLVNADPFRMLELVGRAKLPDDYVARVDGYARDGTTLKVNLCLDALPRFSCLPEPQGQHRATIHLLPDEDGVLEALRAGYHQACAGRLPEHPSIEWYIQTPLDPSLSDAEGRHSSALFVQWVPHQPADGGWEAHEGRYVDHLLSICDRFAPGTSTRVRDVFTLTPPKIERHFGITRGHIHHVDNSFGFADRLPYTTPVQGLYACGAGCHPGGSVIGAAGHNAAMRLLGDMGAAP